MPWATHPWSFEQIGREDIPLAVDHIVRVCGTDKVDVIAHCMGSAMLCMALLGDIPDQGIRGDAYPQLRKEMRGRIRRIVLSQVGPLVVMSPANQARAFLMRYVRQLFPMAEYRFRPDGEGSMADMLLDRLLATLPYPPEEFRLENPRRFWARSPWVRTRHRIDMLYGQVFKLANLSRETLDHLDDFFGPMNVETVSQVIHFARTRAITDVHGRHVFATREQLLKLRDYQILSVHGEENGLVDSKSTMSLLKKELGAAHYDAEPIPGFGHQDCLIGKNARENVFDRIVAFLDEADRLAIAPQPKRAGVLEGVSV
jgi:pimeloyl-ACP methyl ester carboxylesterase